MGTWPTLKLGYDSNDGLARQSAERVAVNARDAGITLQVSPLPQGWWRMPDTGTDIRLQRVRIDGPTLDQAAIEAASRLGFSSGGEFENPERNYGQEQEFLASLTVVPLVYVSELAGVGHRQLRRHCPHGRCPGSRRARLFRLRRSGGGSRPSSPARFPRADYRGRRHSFVGSVAGAIWI